MVTTLVLQMCLFFSSLYLIIFGLFELSIQIYKYVTLPYLVGTLISELILFGLLILVEFVRIQLGKRGNLTNQTVPLISSLLLLAPSLVAVLYSLLWQSYVLRAEVILCSIQIGMQSLTFLIFIIKLISVATQPSV